MGTSRHESFESGSTVNGGDLARDEVSSGRVNSSEFGARRSAWFQTYAIVHVSRTEGVTERADVPGCGCQVPRRCTESQPVLRWGLGGYHGSC